MRLAIRERWHAAEDVCLLCRVASMVSHARRLGHGGHGGHDVSYQHI